MSRGPEFPERRPDDDSFADVLDGFTFTGGRKKRRDRRSERREPEEVRRQEEPRPVLEPEPAPEPEPVEPEAPAASSIRSYTWTGGRTRSNHQLELETLVSTGDAHQSDSVLRLEHQSIAELCRHPRSVAEVGALLSIPIGVARVLLADMADLGLITVHQTVSESGSAPHLMLMERVLSGLRRL